MTIHTQMIFRAECLLCFKGFADPQGEDLNFDTHIGLVEALNRRDWFANGQHQYVLCSTCRHGTVMPKACQCIGSSWFHSTHGLLECDYRESGGVRCEVLGNHERHEWSTHTINHIRAGNGYRCEGIN